MVICFVNKEEAEAKSSPPKIWRRFEPLLAADQICINFIGFRVFCGQDKDVFHASDALVKKSMMSAHAAAADSLGSLLCIALQLSIGIFVRADLV